MAYQTGAWRECAIVLLSLNAFGRRIRAANQPREADTELILPEIRAASRLALLFQFRNPGARTLRILLKP